MNLKKIHIISIATLIVCLITVIAISKLNNLHLTIISLMVFIGVIILTLVISHEFENVEHLLLIIDFTQNRTDIQPNDKKKKITEYLKMATPFQRKLYEFEFKQSFDDLISQANKLAG